MDEISIQVLSEPSEECLEAFARLIPLLGETTPVPDAQTVAKVLASWSNTVFAARARGTIQGLLTLVVLELPTGTEARVEDVVVDTSVRGLGLGRALVAAALDAAEARGARYVDLTSAPHRIAARKLYRSLGFTLRETNTFRRYSP